MTTIVMCPKGEELARNVSWEKTYTLWIVSEHAAAEFKRTAEEILRNIKHYIVDFNRRIHQKANESEGHAGADETSHRSSA
jgi:hypothetical protein